MPVRINCPACSIQLKVSDERVGRPVKCSKCGHTFKAKAAVSPSSAESSAAKPKKTHATPPPLIEKDSEGAAKKPAAKSKPDASDTVPQRRSLLMPVLAIGGVFALLMTCVIGVGGWFAWNHFTAKVPEPLVQNPPDKKIPEERTPPVGDDKTPPVSLNDKLTPEMLAQIKDATVLINVGLQDGRSASGSGFFLEEAGLIATNAHVVGMLDADATPPKQIQIVIRSGEANEKTVAGKILVVDRNADLALVNIDVTPDQPKPLPLKTLPALRETQRIYIFGYPFGEMLGKQSTISESSISSLRGKGDLLTDIQVNGGMHPGNSGGPIVDAGGRLVGVSVSGIRGTQINFAVPGYKLHRLVNGNVTGVHLDDSTPQFGKVRVPVNLEVNDPLQRIQRIDVKCWVGNPGRDRPGGVSEPKAIAGDAPSNLTNAALLPDQRKARTILTMDQVPSADKVMWFQPVITTKSGAKYWGTAMARVVLNPIIPRDITLVRKSDKGVQPLLLNVTSTTRTLQGPEAGRTRIITSETRMNEDIKQVSIADMQYRIQLASASFDVIVNGQERRPDEGVQLSLKQAFRDYFDVGADAQGTLFDLKPNVSTVVTNPQVMAKYLEHVGRGLELTAVPIPGGALKPGQSWRGGRLPTMGAMDSAHPYSFDLVYTYRGVRLHERRETAVIGIEGKFRKNLDLVDGGNIDGDLKATALVSLVNAQVLLFDGSYRVNRKILFDVGNVIDDQQTIDIRLARGNVMGPPPTGPLAGLNGAWCLIKYLDRGVERSLSTEKEEWWIFDAGKIVFTNNELAGNTTSTPIKLRPEIGPTAIDFQMSSSGGVQTRPKGMNPARFEIEGNILKFCLSLDELNRPNDLSCPPNSKRRLFILERVENWRPGYTRQAIHLAKREKLDPGPADDPYALVSDPAPPDPRPCYDLSQGLEEGPALRIPGATRALLAANGNTLVVITGKEILCIDAATRKTVSKIPVLPDLGFAISYDGARIALPSLADKAIKLYDVATGTLAKSFPIVPFKGTSFQFSPGGRYLVGLNPRNDIRIFDTVAGKQVRLLDLRVNDLSLSLDGKYFVATDGKKQFIYDFATLKLLREIPSPFISFKHCGIFSPDSKLVYAPWADKIGAWDRETGNLVMQYTGAVGDGGLWISRDNQFLVSNAQTTKSQVFRIGEAKPIALTYIPGRQPMSHPGRTGYARNSKEVYLRTAKSDPVFTPPALAKEDLSKIPVLKAVEKYKIPIAGTPMPGFGATGFSPNGKYLIVGGKGKQALVVEAATGKTVKTLSFEFEFLSGAAINNDATIAFSTGYTGSITPGKLANDPTFIGKVHVPSGKLDRITGLVGAYKELQISSDDKRLFAIGTDRSLRVWDVKTGAKIHAWENLFRVPRSLELAPDGKMGLMVLDTGPVVLNLQSYREGLKIPQGVGFMKLIGDGARGATIQDRNIVKIWDMKTGNPIKEIELAERDNPRTYGVARSSPDGKYLLLGANSFEGDDLFHLLDIESGKVTARYELKGSRSGVTVFPPTGNLLVLRSMQEVRVIELAPTPK